MASAVVSVETNPIDRQEMYCHRCIRLFIRLDNTRLECPRCRLGFIEEVGANWTDTVNEYLSSYTNTLDSNMSCPQRFDSFNGDNTLGNQNRNWFRSRSLRPMTNEQLQEIPRATITEEQTNKQCAVCLDSFNLNENDVRQLYCSHLFHEKCIFPWISERFLEYRRQFLIDTYGYGGYLEFDNVFRDLNIDDGASDTDSISSGGYGSDYIFNDNSIDNLEPIVWRPSNSFSIPLESQLPVESGTGMSDSLSRIDSQYVPVCEQSTLEQHNNLRALTSATTENIYEASNLQHGEYTSDSSDYEMASSSGSFDYRRFGNNAIEQIDNRFN